MDVTNGAGQSYKLSSLYVEENGGVTRVLINYQMRGIKTSVLTLDKKQAKKLGEALISSAQAGNAWRRIANVT